MPLFRRIRRRVIAPDRMCNFPLDAWRTTAIGAPIPSILLLDLKMPLMTGFEVLEWLQGRAEFAKMLRVVLSQIDDNRSLQRAYTLGAHSFVIKPAGEADLRGLIEAFPGYWTFSGRAGRGVRSDA